MWIRLLTAARVPVLDRDLAIPPYLTPPEIIVWGERFFHRTPPAEVDPAVEMYVEAFTYFVTGRETSRWPIGA